MKKAFAAALSILFLLLATITARASPSGSCCIGPGPFIAYYVGVGLSMASVRSDALESEATGAGLNFIVGGRIIERLSLDFMVDGLFDHPDTKPTTQNRHPADSAEYSTIRFSLKFDFLDLAKESWTPWISVGEVFAFLMWDTYFYSQSGSTFSVALGIDKEFAPGWIFRTSFSTFSVETDDDHGYSGGRLGATTLALSVVYEFGRGRAEKEKPQSPAAFPPSN